MLDWVEIGSKVNYIVFFNSAVIRNSTYDQALSPGQGDLTHYCGSMVFRINAIDDMQITWINIVNNSYCFKKRLMNVDLYATTRT